MIAPIFFIATGAIVTGIAAYLSYKKEDEIVLEDDLLSPPSAPPPPGPDPALLPVPSGLAPPPPPTPVSEADAARLDPKEVEALGRVIASEAGSSSRTIQRAVAWAMRNRSEEERKSIYYLEHDKPGNWGSQKGNSPPFSSAKSASARHLDVAKEVLASPRSADPTGGARSIFEPRLQDMLYPIGKLARAGETGTRWVDPRTLEVFDHAVPGAQKFSKIERFKGQKSTADDVRKAWRNRDKLELFAVAKTNKGEIEFYGYRHKIADRGGNQVYALAGELPDDSNIDAVARAVEASGGKSSAEKQAVAWTVRNRAKKADCSELEISDGDYLDIDPSEESLTVARAVLSLPDGADPTNGAIDFWVPSRQEFNAAIEVLGGGSAPGVAEAREILGACGFKVSGIVGDLELLAFDGDA